MIACQCITVPDVKILLFLLITIMANGINFLVELLKLNYFPKPKTKISSYFVIYKIKLISRQVGVGKLELGANNP